MRIHVFLADDHTIVRDGMRLLLEANEDIKVVGDVSNGRQAVSEVGKLLPDVVIMDIAMPELNGIEATAQIHQHHPEIKVIILSMHSTIEHINRALQAGASGYLLKESAGKEVIDAVITVYEGHRYLSQAISSILIDDYIRQIQTRREISPLESLSPREREVLQLVVEGRTNSEVAEILSLSIKSVETYRSRTMNKLGISDIPGLVKFAIQHGLIPMD
jgi:two-component system, NarL family, response regulator NreC